MESVDTPEEEFEHWYDKDCHQNAISLLDYCRALVDEMGLERGDRFKQDGETLKVHTVDTHSSHASGNVVVSRVGYDDPQPPGGKTSEVSIRDFYCAWKQGEVVPVEPDATGTASQSESHPA